MTSEEPKCETDDKLSRWSELALSWGFREFLGPEDGFRTCLQTMEQWSQRDQPGIYFWIAEDGEAYVGQSLHPQHRLREHWRAHRDLVRACFLPCARDDLNEVEAKLIKKAESHFLLRNIKLAVSTSREVPFDDVVSQAERELFLSGGDLPDAEWRAFDLLARLQKKKFSKFLSVGGSLAALRALQTFVHRALPKPATTEVGFWSVTISSSGCFIRVNAGHQEVFTVTGSVGAIDARVLSATRLRILRSRKSPYQIRSFEDHIASAGLDDWLVGERLLACRRLIVRLTRHTNAINSGSHCPQAVRYDPPEHERVL